MTLTELAVKHQTDKAGAHNYMPRYERYLTVLRHQPVTLLEIGVGGYGDPARGGNSLRVWGEWFTHPDTRIIGIDISPKNLVFDDPRICVLEGSQVDADFLHAIHARYGDFTVVIDDGSHVPDHVIRSFEILFPLVRQTGLYFVEDTQTSYWRGAWSASVRHNPANPTYAYFRQIPDWINYSEIPVDDEVGYFERNIVGVHFFHNLIVVEKGINDEPSNFLPSRTNPRVPAFRRALVPGKALDGQIPLGLLVHVGYLGDVINRTFPSLVVDGVDGRYMQGLQVQSSDEHAGCLQYRVRIGREGWTDWVGCDRFCGTRGQSRDLTGVSIRVDPRYAERYRLQFACAFAGDPTVVFGQSGDECVPMDGARPLVGVQIWLTSLVADRGSDE
jgi:hypothetical protein